MAGGCAQAGKLKEEIQAVRQKLSNKDNETQESLKAATDKLQKASLKLFEMAYKKVRSNSANGQSLLESDFSHKIFTRTNN